MDHGLHLDRSDGTAAFVQLLASLLFALRRRSFARFHSIAATLHIPAIKNLFIDCYEKGLFYYNTNLLAEDSVSTAGSSSTLLVITDASAFVLL